MNDDGSERPQELSTRVNSARLADYQDQMVRLACKVLRLEGDTITVEACDGGQVTIKVPLNTDITDTFIEVVGKVNGPSSIKSAALIGLGADLDLKLVNDTVELIHDPRFYQKMFC